MSINWQQLIPAVAHDARALVRKGITNAQLLERLVPLPEDSQQASQIRAVIDSQHSLNRLFARLVELSDAENPERRGGTPELIGLETAILAAKLDCKDALMKVGAEFTVGPIPSCRVTKRTQVVLRELIDNAVRFGDLSRAVKVIIEADIEDERVRVRVSDTGTGIETAYVDKLFQPLQRLDAARSGFGLGLAISRAIVEAANGRIYHEPRNVGASFAFELPAA